MTDENMFQGGAMTAAENELKRGQKEAMTAAKDLQSAGAAVAENYREKAQQAWGNAKAQALDWQQDGQEFVRQNPIKTVLTALAIGLVLGLAIRR